MKQFQMIYKKTRGLTAWLNQLKDFCEGHSVGQESVLFRIYSNSTDAAKLDGILSQIQDSFPDAVYAGVTTIGNIIHGSLSDTSISLTSTVFEDADSRVQVLQLPVSFETQEESAQTLLDTVAQNPWISAIEMMTTLSMVDMPEFCRTISALPSGIRFYGGGAHAIEVVNGDTRETFVLSSQGQPSRNSAVFILMGGPRLRIETGSLTGWRKLGREFKVTDARKNLLYGIDGQPAAELYQHYLHIPDDGRFYRVANEFPLLFKEKGNEYLRVVASAQPDGALRLGSTIDNAEFCNITYGDPIHIIETIKEEAKKIHSFAPQTIQLFSCAARKFFWGNSEISRETIPFEILAPASGFFTAAEFLRSGQDIIMHNVTLVYAAFREEGIEEEHKEYTEYGEETFSHQLTISSCLAYFIQAQAKEMAALQEKVNRLEEEADRRKESQS